MENGVSLGLHHGGLIQKIDSFLDTQKPIYIIREDLLHPLISGNKWRKLSGYLFKAIQQGHEGILTFGGPFSNHIIATAASCLKFNIKCVGIIRGMDADLYNPILREAISLGMKILKIPRDAYKARQQSFLVQSIKDSHPNFLCVDEGGSGKLGLLGFETIIKRITQIWSQNKRIAIVVAMGTGTTFGGLTAFSSPNIDIFGVPVLLYDNIVNDLNKKYNLNLQNTSIYHNYSFGGFAKYHSELFVFMNYLYIKHQIPTDFIYTGKLFYAAHDLMTRNVFNAYDYIVIYHSGGLKGNATVKDMLEF